MKNKIRLYCFPIVIMLLFLVNTLAQADIYKYIDKHGHLMLTDNPTHEGYKRLVKTWKGWEEAKELPENFNLLKNKKNLIQLFAV